jgi:glucose-6-phosphate 1-epimerase
MSNSQDLDAKRLPPSVTIATGSALPRLDVATAQATAHVYLHGAHLAAWQPAHAAAPVLWMSGHSFFRADKPIRGGVPICFPWFGPHAQDRSVPAHGFARLSPWTLCDARESADGFVHLSLELEADNASPVWPHHFHADLRLIIGSVLEMALDVHNADSVPFTFEAALHTYFAVGRIDRVTVAGLEQAEYIDKVGGGARVREAGAPITLAGETDRLYLDTDSTCAIDDPVMGRRITIAKQGSRSTVVWNPWIDKARAMPDFGDGEWPGMLCIETANVGSAAVTLRPGDRHTMSATISVEAA